MVCQGTAFAGLRAGKDVEAKLVAFLQYTEATLPLDDVEWTLSGVRVRWSTFVEMDRTVSKDIRTEGVAETRED